MKIALIGYGKMGRMIEETARQRGHEIVSIIDVDNQQDFDSDAFRSADVAIEFTTPKSAYDNYLKAWAQGVKVVSGSTGWMAEHGDEVKKACAEGKTLFWASNFSIGVAIFAAVNRYLAKIMNKFPQYDVRMEETHHIHKLDHPSGTAVTLAEDIVKNIDRIEKWEPTLNPSPREGSQEMVSSNQSPLPSGETGVLPIHCFREGEVPGIHSICYDSDADEITITHDAHSRKGFALGAVLAAEFTKDHEGLLTINDLFDF